MIILQVRKQAQRWQRDLPRWSSTLIPGAWTPTQHSVQGHSSILTGSSVQWATAAALPGRVLNTFPAESVPNLSHLTRAPSPADGSERHQEGRSQVITLAVSPLHPRIFLTPQPPSLPSPVLWWSRSFLPPRAASLYVLSQPSPDTTPQPPSLTSPSCVTHFPPLSPSLQCTNTLKFLYCHLKFLQSSQKPKSRWLSNTLKTLKETPPKKCNLLLWVLIFSTELGRGQKFQMVQY